ncbi:hypothetical protein Pla175_31600 [Pirellulimonas nuda]|uniref:PEP-CTERM protein-sorting domain-containing protein n=1 Tax=Pirellulimonas nuda TaxID=2528009 RepID=A0A518DE56_9BACT|nr:hypothetical protein [Pirellulimonas nuda]QDU89765.1 hypothetical protein Pla175_31600 [Pirellulimonas nuda]
MFAYLSAGPIALCATILATAGAYADHPIFLQEYRVLPAHSVIHQTGGFAGVDVRYRLKGEYDLATGFDEGRRFAEFTRAEITGLNRSLSTVSDSIGALDVDQALNLLGLEGRFVPLGLSHNVWEFSGQSGDDSSVHLLAAQRGPWMLLRGVTTPPPGSADFFQYNVRWLARTGPSADMNGDGAVDAADYTSLRDGHLDGGADIALWRSQFGEQADIAELDGMMDAAWAAKSGVASGAGVPEPSGLVLLGTIASALVCRWRRTRA